MTIGEKILKLGLNPGVLSGITLRQWLSLLGANGLVAPRYWPRAAVITMTSTVNTLLGAWEHMVYHRRWEAVELQPPVIVLGVGRSGTTHLHNLLSRDSRFGYLTFFQSRFPRVLLSAERLARPILSNAIPPKRLQDNIPIQFDSAAEDEDALCSLTLLSVRLSRVFGNRATVYERFRTCDGFSDSEAEQWKKSFLMLLRKLTLRYQRPLITKSPRHSALIPMVLDVVPKARFVFIHRDPGDVLRSARHLERSIASVTALQPAYRSEDHETVSHFCTTMNCYFQHRSLIPKGNLVEIGYDGLVRDPIETIRTIYAALSLPDFRVFEPELRTYVETISGYQKNRHTISASAMREQVARECPRWFEEWAYPVQRCDEPADARS